MMAAQQVQGWLSNPQGMAADGTGSLYIADADNHRIRQVDTTGTIHHRRGDRCDRLRRETVNWR